MPYKRGDVVFMLFPDSNLRTAKRRPALVIQADNLVTGLPQTIIAMITSNMVARVIRVALRYRSILRKVNKPAFSWIQL